MIVHRIANMTILLVVIGTSFFFVYLAIHHSWITLQLIVFLILKLSIAKNHDTGCAAALAAAAAYYGLPDAWDDELDHSSPTSTDSHYASHEEPMAPEIIKEALEEEEEEKNDEDDVDDEKDTVDVITSSMHEIRRAIMEARGEAASGARERHRESLESDAEWETAARTRETKRKRSDANMMKDEVDVKAAALRKEASLGAWRRSRDAIGGDVRHDQLFRRLDTYIRMQHEYLRQQQRESDRRRFLERLQQRSSY